MLRTFRADQFWFGIVFLILVLSLVSDRAFCESKSESSLLRLLQEKERDTPGLSISLATGFSERAIASYRADELFIPASIQKLITTHASLRTLGLDYTFETNYWFVDSDETLVIDPGADPTLVSESLLPPIRALRALTRGKVSNVVILMRSEDTFIPATGPRAYEAAVSPLAFNFNAIGVRVCPPSKGAELKVFPLSAIPSGTLANLVRQGQEHSLALSSSQSGWQISGSVLHGAPCTEMYRSVEDPAEYFLAELKVLAKAFDVKISAKTVSSLALMPAKARLLYTTKSKPLYELLVTMNQQSSNFYAQQLALAVARKTAGSYSYEKGIFQIRRSAPSMKVADASGLSRENRSSAAAILHVIRELWADSESRGVVEGSLPVYGRSGTLRNRHTPLEGCTVRAKTGTLDGVSSIAGLMYSQGKDPGFFTMIQNGTRSLDAGRAFEDLFLKEFCGVLRANKH